MKSQRLGGLKSNEILLLSYIYKYHRIDVFELQQELDLSGGAIAAIAERLFDKGYIRYSNMNNRRTSITVTDKIAEKYITDWDKRTKFRDREAEKADFFRAIYCMFPINLILYRAG